MVTALTINYNTPDYLERLLKSFRQFYDIPYLVIDGSDKQNYEKIKDFPKKFNIELLHFNYNIHHGPGMALGLQRIKTEQVLLVDSDMIIFSGGWLEMMQNDLLSTSYGIGDIQKECYEERRRVSTSVSKRGRELGRRRIINQTTKVWIDYLHPAFALVNRMVALKYPLPAKGGAPLLWAMMSIHQQRHKVLQRADWLTDDLWNHTKKYVQHNGDHAGMGTVVRTGGYHLE